VIVVEGFDCSGKSTLANKIGAALKWDVLHTGGPTKDCHDVERCIARSYARMHMKCVQDRVTHISETVYSMLTHPEKAAIALNSIREIAVAELVIYCRPPTEFLLEEFMNHERKDHDDFTELETLERNAPMVIRTYDTIMHLVAQYVGVRLLKHDRTDPRSEQQIIDIVRRKFG